MPNFGTNALAAVALNRFGFGAAPGDPVPANPRSWLLQQLQGQDSFTQPQAPSLSQCLNTLLQQHNGAKGTVPILFQQECEDFVTNAYTTQTPFRERLVWFWTNHFSCLATQDGAQACSGAFVRDVIRPNVTGTFAQMLIAAMQHPAMIYSLTNQASTGPHSQQGLRCQTSHCPNIGINENMARETLELFTVGLAANYTQADVDALAMIYTGWTVNLQKQPYGFTFDPTAHEPANQTLMQQTYPPTFAGGIAALQWLGTHPLTYQMLATKLVTHFCSDTPDPADVAVVVAALSASGGNLAAAATAVTGLRSAWIPMTKLRTPAEYVIAAMRAVGATGSLGGLAGDPRVAALSLGQNIWTPELPNGYSDLFADWMGSAQFLLRADFAAGFGKLLTLINANADAVQTAVSCLGPLLRPSTVSAIRQAARPQDQFTLLFLSPEFQRR